jgi:phosphoribosylamine-glycine ligase
MKSLVGKFTFTVPEGHAQAGQTIEKPFEYSVVETDTEANAVLTEKKLSLIELVNDNLKKNARSNASVGSSCGRHLRAYASRRYPHRNVRGTGQCFHRVVEGSQAVTVETLGRDYISWPNLFILPRKFHAI